MGLSASFADAGILINGVKNQIGSSLISCTKPSAAYGESMTKTRIAKKKATRKAKEKAAEGGVSAAQRVFAKVLEKADPTQKRQ